MVRCLLGWPRASWSAPGSSAMFLVAGGVASGCLGAAGVAMGAGRVIGGTGVVGCSVWAVPGMWGRAGKWFPGGSGLVVVSVKCGS